MNFDKANDKNYFLGMTVIAINIVLWAFGGHLTSYLLLLGFSIGVVWFSHRQAKRFNSLLDAYGELVEELNKGEKHVKHK